MSNWIKKCKHYWKQAVYHILGFLIAYVGQGLIHLISMTCRIKIEGLERFKETAINNKCILALWHNRLALIPSILYKNAPKFIYAALVSKSRDGELLSKVVHAYKAGRTIRVSHQQRHQALRDIIEHLENREIVIITPDGPRGPCYQIKPGIAWTALESGALIVPLNWSANKFWEFNTWDRLRLPKPFATVHVTFGEPLFLDKSAGSDLHQATEILSQHLFT